MMPKVVKFTYDTIVRLGVRDYTCDQPGDQSGEYVPLAEVKGLRRLVERVIEVNGRAVSGDKLYLSELTGLVEDCRKALEGGE